MTGVFNNSTASGATAASDTAAVKANGTDPTSDMFLTLLVAQIKNQDPLNPSDASQFVNQLAQMSQTSSLQSLVKQGTTAASQMDTLQMLSLGARVGSSVSVRTDSVQVGDQAIGGSFDLTSGSSAVSVVLTNAQGKEYSVALGSRGPGQSTFTIDPASLGLAPGQYGIAVKAAGGEAPGVDITGKLESVKVSGSAGTVLKVVNVGEISSSAISGFNSPAG